MPGMVDYSMARRAVLRDLASGRTSRLEACDAHPDLLRAAKYCGEVTQDVCPVCDKGPLALVSYVFSDELPKRENGMVWSRENLNPLLRYGEVRLYTVEVCTDCSWNHLRSQVAVGKGSGRRSPTRRERRASK
jgi:hypothetical protein